MSVFLNQVFAFPTVVLTVGLTIVVIYWAFVILGALDIDTFDFDGLAEGAVEGSVEGAMEGSVEGAMEGSVEGAMEGSVEGAMEGGAEGAMEGSAEAAGEAAEAAEAVAHGFSFLGLMSTMGLRRAPFTVTFSLLILAAWVFCMLGMQHAAPHLAFLPGFAVGTIMLLTSVALAVPITSATSRPLGPLFVTHEAERNRDLVGRTCRINTGTVDAKFGQATIEEGGSWTVIQVRNVTGRPLERGDEALIIAYDHELEAFRVESMAASASKDARNDEG